MPDPLTGTIAAVTTLGGAAVKSKSASKAANAQVEASEAGIAEQRRQSERLEQLLQPYTGAGIPALQGMMDLIGLPYNTGGGYAPQGQGFQQTQPYGYTTGMVDDRFGFNMGDGGPVGFPGAPGSQPAQLTQGERQRQAIDAQANNPLFLALAQQGEDAILQNASATGGLRGGNVKGALARFRPALLNQFINQQYDRMAGIAALGQNSAAGVGNAGIQTGTNIANLLADAGAARAGKSLAQGNIWGGMLGQIGGAVAGRGF